MLILLLYDSNGSPNPVVPRKKIWRLKSLMMSLLMLLGVKKNVVCALADSGFLKNFLYQGGMKSTVFWVFEDLKFKISESYD